MTTHIEVPRSNGIAGSSTLASGPGVVPLSAAEIVGAAGIEGLAAELGSPAEYLLGTTGKNLRSTMVLQCAQAGPRPADPLVRTGAIAVELGHLATLAHDDVIDDGTVRRGADAVGVVYGSLAAGFLGGSLFARAGELIAACGPAPTSRFAQAAAEVCAGQMLEFEDLFNPARSLERYHRAIAGKTASLFELSAWVGPTLAGADPGTVDSLARFGREFGVAFQLADDILDLAAEVERTGKTRGKDLQQGVYTAPAIHAIAADPTLAVALTEVSGEEDLPELIERVERCGGLDRGLAECLDWAGRARATLAGLGDSALGAQLDELVRRSVARIPHPAAAAFARDA